MKKYLMYFILCMLPMLSQAAIVILPDGTIINCTERDKIVVCI